MCIYCGGVNAATTVEHMPPAVMFRRKHRPKGLEFAACADCNLGSSHADLVAALLSRVYPDSPNPAEAGEFRALCQAVHNNVPGLLQEMLLSPEEQRARGGGLPPKITNGLVRAGGPILTRYMHAFSLKVGLALHYECTKQVLPPEGLVGARLFSNFDRLAGDFPDTIFDHLLPPQTLVQGQFEVSDQFQYAWRLTEDGRGGLYFAAFRYSFAVVSFAAHHATLLDSREGVPKHSPVEFAGMLRAL
jgi:hypothetical protein